MPPRMSARILYVPCDHLNRKRGALRTATPGVDTIVLENFYRAQRLRQLERFIEQHLAGFGPYGCALRR
jgi:hypothetical protein